MAGGDRFRAARENALMEEPSKVRLSHLLMRIFLVVIELCRRP